MKKAIASRAPATARPAVPAGFDPARRAALAKLGRFAIYTAPVMTTLLITQEARGNHKPGHLGGPVDVCTLPNPPPQCDQTCEDDPTLPGCGSLVGGQASPAEFSGEDFETTSEPAYDADDSSSSDF